MPNKPGKPRKVSEAAVNKALREAVLAIYFADSSDYGTALWQVVKALDPKLCKLLERDEKAAVEIVAPDLKE